MLIFGIYTRCQWMKVKVRCSNFECREDIQFKTQAGPVAKNATPRPPDVLSRSSVKCVCE